MTVTEGGGVTSWKRTLPLYGASARGAGSAEGPAKVAEWRGASKGPSHLGPSIVPGVTTLMLLAPSCTSENGELVKSGL